MAMGGSDVREQSSLFSHISILPPPMLRHRGPASRVILSEHIEKAISQSVHKAHGVFRAYLRLSLWDLCDSVRDMIFVLLEIRAQRRSKGEALGWGDAFGEGERACHSTALMALSRIEGLISSSRRRRPLISSGDLCKSVSLCVQKISLLTLWL